MNARTFRPTPRNIAFLANRLREGALVAVPTETVYGLAANAFDPRACQAIFRAKGRPADDPLIVHVHALSQLAEICVPNPAALKLAGAFWPGPLTLILPKLPSVSNIVTASRDSVGVRMPRHPAFRALLKRAGIPLAAPSANPFGYISPTTAQHVLDNLGRRIRYVLDGGAAPIGLESTILDLRDPNRPRLLRPGAISAAQISRVLGQTVATARRRSSANSGAQVAPGMLARHYSPRTPVVLHERLIAGNARDEAYLFLRKPADANGGNIYWLDSRGDLRRAARRLFATLRQIDRSGYRRIHAERAGGNDGFAAAINDRLTRAAAR